MYSKQLKALLEQLDALKPSNLSTEFHAGIDAAKGLISDAMDRAFHSDRIAELEAELKELKEKYETEKAPKPKRKSRQPRKAQSKS
jgi:hypothetical protein